MRTLKEQQDAGIILFWCLVLAGLVVLFCPKVHAEDYDPVMTCDAIFHAEGGSHATYLYGIRSVRYKDVAEARHICIRTVKHARLDWNGHGDFLEFLSCRYAPIGCANDPHGLNRHWLKNVRYWLRKDAHDRNN